MVESILFSKLWAVSGWCHPRRKKITAVVNTVTQVTADPNKLMVAINKQNATTSAVLANGRLRPPCCTDAPWS